ncbi:MAG: DUF115 domain-containing protein [Lachnospiraceae bacterium]|nr:DUF115 domain-containing protein [Lachnospiraceae bacterium]
MDVYHGTVKDMKTVELRNCGAKEFIERLQGRKVICFGAGSMLIEADYEVLKIDHLEEHIALFIDNATNKHGLKYKYRGYEYDIKSVDALNGIDVKDYVLLITCAVYVEIYKQLRDIPAAGGLECYMYNVVCSYPELDVNQFFTKEIEKHPYKDWKAVLKSLNLKDKHKGERCFVIGNGPSLTVKDLDLLKDEVTFAVNRIFKLFDETVWRPTYYFCIDYLLYGLDYKEINNVEAKLRFIPIQRALAAGAVFDEITYYNREINCVTIKEGEIVRGKEFEFSDDFEKVAYGGQTVLYDTLQIAAYMGFSEIYLIGVDCDFKQEVLEDGTVIENNSKKEHFNEKYDEGFDKAVAVVAPVYALIAAFQKAKEKCEEKGIVIKNATRGGKLEVFERVSLEDVLADEMKENM